MWYNDIDNAQVTLRSRNTGELYQIVGPLSKKFNNKIVYALSPTGAPVTIKCIHKGKSYVDDGLGKVLCLREWNLMKGLTRADVAGSVKMCESWSDDETIYMVRVCSVSFLLSCCGNADILGGLKQFFEWSLVSWMGYCDEVVFSKFAVLLVSYYVPRL